MIEIPIAAKNFDFKWYTKYPNTKPIATIIKAISANKSSRISSKKVVNENMSALKPIASTVFFSEKSFL